MNIIALKGYLDKFQAGLTAQQELKAKITALTAELSPMVAETEGLKKLMLGEVQSSGDKTVKIGAVSLTATPGKDSLKIEDPTLIPANYTKQVIEPNNAAIKAALLNGSEVPGARIVTGAPYLTIK